MYIAEIAPAHLRGRFVSINQLTVVLGILTSQIVNWQIAEPVALGATHEMIRESWNGQMGWRWMFWAMTVPAALFFVFSFILPGHSQTDKAGADQRRYQPEYHKHYKRTFLIKNTPL